MPIYRRSHNVITQKIIISTHRTNEIWAPLYSTAHCIITIGALLKSLGIAKFLLFQFCLLIRLWFRALDSLDSPTAASRRKRMRDSQSACRILDPCRIVCKCNISLHLVQIISLSNGRSFKMTQIHEPGSSTTPAFNKLQHPTRHVSYVLFPPSFNE